MEKSSLEPYLCKRKILKGVRTWMSMWNWDYAIIVKNFLVLKKTSHVCPILCTYPSTILDNFSISVHKNYFLHIFVFYSILFIYYIEIYKYGTSINLFLLCMFLQRFFFIPTTPTGSISFIWRETSMVKSVGEEVKNLKIIGESLDHFLSHTVSNSLRTKISLMTHQREFPSSKRIVSFHWKHIIQ